MSALFQLPLVVFFAPVLLALALWAVSALGLLTHDNMAADGGDTIETGGDGVVHGALLEYLGLGVIPLQIFLSLLIFLFGWIGIGLHVLLPGLSLWLSVPGSALLALLANGASARRMRPLFQSYGQATRRDELVGRLAVLSSSEFTPDFGLARVKLPDGAWVEVPVRAEEPLPAPLPHGAPLVLTRYDDQAQLYFATPFDA